jgi:hypothetical protein
MARRRPSGPGSNSRRFADIKRPDGSIDKVPAAKDAATYLFLATASGEWPPQFFVKFLYDAVSLDQGTVFELQEMRPGEGMGRISRLKVLSAHSRIDVYPNGHGQLRRLVLVEEMPDTDERGRHPEVELDRGDRGS